MTLFICFPSDEQMCDASLSVFTCLCRIVSRNRIALLGKDGSFRKLRSLKRIDLSHNQLIKIEEGAFSGAQSVLEL